MKYIALPIIALATLALAMNNTVLSDVQSSSKQLICNGKHIDSSKVIDFQDGIWFFTNGYAKNCEVK